MRQPLISSTTSGTLSNTTVQYYSGHGHTGGGVGTAANAKTYLRAGILRNFLFLLSAAPGVGTDYTAKLIKNGSTTLATLTVSGASATQTIDVATQAAIADGDYVQWEVTPTGTPTAVQAWFACELEPTTANRYIATTIVNAAPTVSVDNYAYVGIGDVSGLATTESAKWNIWPHACTGIDFHVYLDTAPGAGNSIVFTLRINGLDTALTLAISDTNTSGNITGQAVAIAAGDQLGFEITPSATAADPVNISLLLTIQPTTGGESILTGASSDDPTSGATHNYQNITGSQAEDTTTLTDRQHAMPPEPGGSTANYWTFKNLYCRIESAPAGGDLWDVTVHKDGSNTALTAQITTGNNEGSDTSNSFQAGLASKIGIDWVGTGNPAVNDYSWSVVVLNTYAVKDIIGMGIIPFAR